MKFPFTIVAATCLATSLAAAGCGAPVASGPPQLHPGSDTCSRCRMIISENRTAVVARRTEPSAEARFDDIGCATAFLRKRTGEHWQVWVFDGLSWRTADSARYTADRQRITPMGYGLMAYPDAESAARAASGGRVLRWSSVLALSTTEAGPVEPDRQGL